MKCGNCNCRQGRDCIKKDESLAFVACVIGMIGIGFILALGGVR